MVNEVKNTDTLKSYIIKYLFQEYKTGYPTEYAYIEQIMSPIALEITTIWINKTPLHLDLISQ